MKPDSLYNSGMKPLLYSERAFQQKSVFLLFDYPNIRSCFPLETGWYRDGSEICYYQNNMKKKNAGFYYTLTFTLSFSCTLPSFSVNLGGIIVDDYDTVYIAHCYPYTYSQLCKSLKMLENDKSNGSKFRRRTLCQTIAGNK